MNKPGGKKPLLDSRKRIHFTGEKGLVKGVAGEAELGQTSNESELQSKELFADLYISRNTICDICLLSSRSYPPT